jgi:dethiobiotin synthetase
VIVEGAGGWFAPINEHQTMADLAWALSIPALMVVGLRLGCLNHAQLTRLAIEAHGVTLRGWIASAVDADFARAEENLAALVRLLGEPALTLVPHLPEPHALCLDACAAQLAQRSLSI